MKDGSHRWLALRVGYGIVTSLALVVLQLGCSRSSDPEAIAETRISIQHALEQRDFAAAQTMAERQTGRTRTEFGVNSVEYAVAVSDAALVLNKMSRFAEADSLYREAVRTIESLGRSAIIQSYFIYNRYGVNLRSLGRLEESESCLKRALEMAGSLGGMNTSDSLRAMSELAATQLRLGKFNDAKTSISGVIARYETTSDTLHPNFATSLVTLGDICIGLGEVSEAASLIRRGLSLLERATTLTSVETQAVGYGNLGKCYAALANYQEAAEYFQKAESLFLSIGDASSCFVVVNHIELGKVKFFLGQLDEADSLLSAGIVGLQHCQGNPETLPSTLVWKATVLFNRGNRSGAYDLVKRARDLTLALPLPSEQLLFGVLDNCISLARENHDSSAYERAVRDAAYFSRYRLGESSAAYSKYSAMLDSLDDRPR